jgi:hypothetical protein
MPGKQGLEGLKPALLALSSHVIMGFLPLAPSRSGVSPTVAGIRQCRAAAPRAGRRVVSLQGIAAALLLTGLAPLASAQTCAPTTTVLCLSASRFRVEAQWRPAAGAALAAATAVPITSDTGYFWFFSATNIEVVVKVLNACPVDGHYWVFASGLTNLEVMLRVTDTRTGQVRTYTSPPGGAFAPISDTSAFVCGADHYASVSGSGTACTLASPCSLDTAVCAAGAVTPCAEAAPAPGDVVWLRGGTYPAITNDSNGSGISLHGTARSPVTIRNYQDGSPYGEEVIIDGSQNPNNGRPTFNLWVSSNIIVKGLIFNNLSTRSRYYASGVPGDRYEGIGGGFGGIQVLNCFSMNNLVGFQRSTANTPSDAGALYYGDTSLYNGYDSHDNGRGSGHEFYLQNSGDFTVTTATTNLPVVLQDSIAAYDFYQNVHFYTEDGQILRMQMLGSASVNSGLLSIITPNNPGDAVTGANGTPSTSCTDSTKMFYQPVFNGNLFYDSTPGNFNQTLGYLKGTCDATVTNNTMYGGPGGTTLVLGPSFSGGTLTTCATAVVNGVCMNGNTFIGATDGFAQSSYASNAYLATKPASGKTFSYHPNAYDSGRGWVAVYNWDHSESVSIDPGQMGAYPGESYKICHYLDPIPYTCAAIAAGSWQGGSIAVATSGLHVLSPNGTDFTAPVETGPEFNIYILYDTGRQAP